MAQLYWYLFTEGAPSAISQVLQRLARSSLVQRT